MRRRPVPLVSAGRLVTVIGRLALAVASTVALVIPLGYSALEYANLAYRTDRQALVKAGAMTALVSGNPSLWSYQTQRIEDLLVHYPVPMDGDRVSVYDEQDGWLLSVGEPPAPPVLARSRPLYDSGRVVGRVAVEHSLRALVYEALVAAMLGLLLGGAVYAVLRTLPLRALRRMSIALDKEHAALRSSEERYRTVAEFTYDWEYWRSPDGGLPYVSPSCLRVTGYQASDFRQDPGLLLRIVHPDDREALDRHFHEVETPQTQTDHSERDFRILTRDGEERWLAHVCQHISDRDGKYLGRRACNRDITERKRAEAMHAELEAQLAESQKMEAIGTLAGGIAHDFNNILATILGNVELARQDLSAGDSSGRESAPQAAAGAPGASARRAGAPAHAHALVLESLDEICKAGSRARDLVQQILAFSRRQPVERRPTALAAVVEESARLLRATLPARLTLEVQCEAPVPAVLADATQIQQVLINLATNAMQAMRGRPGRIGIRLDTVPLDAALADRHPALRTLLAQHPGRIVRLAVSDDGPGMDETTRARAFEPFFTTKAADEGTGLGLSVVHGIVRAHGGAIEIDSAPGKGAVFTILLPAATAQPGAPEAEPGAEPAAAAKRQGSDQHILYLDDDEALVFLIRRLLERRGFRISGYTDQQEALAALRADPAGFDLVVTDYNMPGMSGLDVARAVRAIRADLPVAVASGFVDEALRAQAGAAGVRELIFKADAAEDLCDALVRLVPVADATATGR